MYIRNNEYIISDEINFNHIKIVLPATNEPLLLPFYLDP